MPCGFGAYWQDSRMENRRSVYVRDTELDLFEIVLSSTLVRMRRTAGQRIPLHQLSLLYRIVRMSGNEIIVSYETWQGGIHCVTLHIRSTNTQDMPTYRNSLVQELQELFAWHYAFTLR